jgi:hypothetical protein
MKVLVTDQGTFNLFQYKGERIPAVFDLTELQLTILKSQGINYKVIEKVKNPKLPKVIDRDSELASRKAAREKSLPTETVEDKKNKFYSKKDKAVEPTN